MSNQEQEPRSFKMYTGKAPLLLQIFAGLLWLNGLALIVSGIMSLLVSSWFYGILAPIIGVLAIKFARGLFKLDSTVYRPTIILQLTIIFFCFFSI